MHSGCRNRHQTDCNCLVQLHRRVLVAAKETASTLLMNKNDCHVENYVTVVRERVWRTHVPNAIGTTRHWTPSSSTPDTLRHSDIRAVVNHESLHAKVARVANVAGCAIHQYTAGEVSIACWTMTQGSTK